MRFQSVSAVSPKSLREIPQNGFPGVKVLVVGDLMLDQYVEGEVHRISPEAPVPVLSVRKRRFVPGGAGNVALNVLGLQAETVVAGVIGADPAGKLLLDLLSQSRANTRGIITAPSRPTTSKTRVVSGNHQIVRLDEETSEPLDGHLERELTERAIACLDQGDINAVLLSDYGKGVLSRGSPQILIEECKQRGTPVLVDPKRSDYLAYRGATCVTPNQKEFFAAVAAMGIRPGDIDFAGSILREQLECTALLVTQGGEGMTLLTAGQGQHLPALTEEVFDVSGAGDTVIATLGVALGLGLTFQCAVELANAAASIVVRKAGTTPVAWRDLSELLGMDSVLPPTEEAGSSRDLLNRY
jgi:D-beta-D-heptose 7-phosphate kinase / D-beta-D-heptose 1-phosphate adenosyltransferase